MTHSLWTAGRLRGALRYHSLWMGRLVLWLTGILLAGRLLTLALAAADVAVYRAEGITGDFGTMMLLMLVCAMMMAGKRTTFLTRFGAPRLSVWLSALIALVAGMACYLLLSIATSALTGYLALALSGAMPDRVQLASYYNEYTGAALLSHTLADTLRALPMQLLWTLEWACLYYLLACCYRRWRALTLAVVIGVPTALFMLMLVPAVNETIAAIESGAEGEILILGVQWLSMLNDVVDFVHEHWQTIQLGAAAASLPLSYLVMRATPQP